MRDFILRHVVRGSMRFGDHDRIKIVIWTTVERYDPITTGLVARISM